jgi:hypothetical protein
MAYIQPGQLRHNRLNINLVGVTYSYKVPFDTCRIFSLGLVVFELRVRKLMAEQSRQEGDKVEP